MTWQLRRASSADLDAIMELERASFTTDAWSRRSMARELEHPHCYYLVGFDAEAPVPTPIEGYAGLLCPPGASDADIQTIAVSARSQGKGLGRQLMGQLLTEAGTRGASAVFLEVREDNPVARALYASLGFAEIAVRTAYYQPDGVDAVVMRLELPKRESGFAARPEEGSGA
jgi:ribosomal-protein-alanine acetyltransferase